MAQAFLTTYQKYHRWHQIDKRPSLRPVDKLAETLPEGDIWIIPKKIGEDDQEGGQGLAAAEAAVHRMYRNRLWSTYLVSYCSEMIAKEEAKAHTPPGNAILLYGESLYGARTQKIPPPLPSARRIYGYIRPSRMYVPITTYQNLHGRVGYEILLENSQSKPERTDRRPSDSAVKETEEKQTPSSAAQKQPEKPKATSNQKEMKFDQKVEKLPSGGRMNQLERRISCPCRRM